MKDVNPKPGDREGLFPIPALMRDFHKWQKGVGNDDVDAIIEMATKCEENRCDAQALYYWQLAVDYGRPSAMLRLGLLYLTGLRQIKRDMYSAIHWLCQAAKAGSTKAAALVGMYHEILFWQFFDEIFPEKKTAETEATRMWAEDRFKKRVASYPLDEEKITNDEAEKVTEEYFHQEENEETKQLNLWPKDKWKEIIVTPTSTKKIPSNIERMQELGKESVRWYTLALENNYWEAPDRLGINRIHTIKQIRKCDLPYETKLQDLHQHLQRILPKNLY